MVSKSPIYKKYPKFPSRLYQYANIHKDRKEKKQ